ncbi:MAG: His/Gly/Thr/Pro-type tRNA ligase C-terminal domain-containing protein [Minisyncoccota bacterium]
MSKTDSRPNYFLREFDRPLYLATHFGFIPIEAPRVTEEDLKIIKNSPRAGELSALLRTYLEKEFSNLSHPLALSYKKNRGYSLHLLGLQSALAESILIRTALSILEDFGHKHLVVEVNSMGDKDSIESYERELHHYLKKIIDEVSAEHRKVLKEDIFELLKLNLLDEIKENIPPSIASLSSSSREHFKEALEYLESLGVEFRLSCDLFENKHYASHTIFVIRDLDDESVLASGARYSRLSKKLGFKKELPAISMHISASKKLAQKERIYKDLPKPKFYLVQLGREAKMKSLPLIELLRTNHIPIYHFLGKDKIVPQLQNAENLKVPYLLIVGQKEALEDSVTIRNCNTRAQETVRMADLPAFLKNITL